MLRARAKKIRRTSSGGRHNDGECYACARETRALRKKHEAERAAMMDRLKKRDAEYDARFPNHPGVTHQKAKDWQLRFWGLI